MAEAGTTEGPPPTLKENPLYTLVLGDLTDRKKWADIDAQIIKRRLGERKKRKTKPYRGAPNGQVPIVDDTTRDKTNQEMAMIHNAPRYIHVIPLDKNMPSEAIQMLLVGFDTFLRHVIHAPPKIEEGLDTKNARGMALYQVITTEDPRFGKIADFDAVDPRDVIVPAGTKELKNSERITKVIRYTASEFERLGNDNDDWQNVTEVLAAAKTDRRSQSAGDSNTDDSLEVAKGLIGISTSGKDTKWVILWETLHIANEWSVENDRTKELKVGDRARALYSPDLPDSVINMTPWKDVDEVVDMDEAELAKEQTTATTEARQARTKKTVEGKNRPWNFIQPRYENRSRFYHNTRGIGHLCMDDQIFATAMLNAKMTAVDYMGLPLFTGTGSRQAGNVSYAPGSYVSGDQKIVEMQPIPSSFDFTIDGHKRAASRRVGTVGATEFSSQITETRKVQKTKGEVDADIGRGAMVSNADVQRFNEPFAELYQQLYEVLKREGTSLPMIANDQFTGMTDESIYKWPVLIVPASSAKTLDPDAQFRRSTAAWSFAVEELLPLGVTLDPQAAAVDILSYWDPFVAQRWILDPTKDNPGGLPPVYKMLEDLTKQLQQVSEENQQVIEVVESTAKLAEENSQKIEEAEAEAEQREKPAEFFVEPGVTG